MTKKTKIISIIGPSASGKSALAVEIAKEFNGEIISCDSRIIYKDFDIATAKPTEEEMQGIKHHFVGNILPTDDFSAADFADEAKKVINDIVTRGKLPIVAGGTGLYFRILLEDFDIPRVAPNEKLRAELEQKSTDELYSLLQKKDPKLAAKIHKNNKVKIIRALEVCEELNTPMSEAQKKKEPEFDVLWIGLNAENRDYLYNRINRRVDIMLEQGLLEEAKSIIDKYKGLPLIEQTIGYQEFIPYFKGDITFEEAVSDIKQNTRRYSKRQLTWFRANKSVIWLFIDKLSNEELIKNAKNLVKNFIQTGNY